MTKPHFHNMYLQTQPYRKLWKENSNPRKLTTLTKTQATDNPTSPETTGKEEQINPAAKIHNTADKSKSKTNKH